jgi:hypothetical protein
MRKLALTLTLAACVCGSAFAQEEPIPPKRSRMVKVGLFGGFTPGMLFPDIKPVNDFLSAGRGARLKEDGMFLWGGAGAAYIMLVPNLRVGGAGMSGALKSTSVSTIGIRRDAELRIGYGGVTIEYVVPIVERFDFAVGGLLGAGGIDLILRQSNGGTNTWIGEQNYLASGLGTPANNITRTLSGSFFIYVPSASFEYSFLGWMALRVGASYVGMAAPSWKVDGNYDLIGVPADVSGKGFMINAGVLIGTF